MFIKWVHNNNQLDTLPLQISIISGLMLFKSPKNQVPIDLHLNNSLGSSVELPE